ncbi:reverse transcriptase [Phytophthora megakarya]|uniref:Reverse transcriptase n=1 Tax=Phytophthora megakarya TaxID=4795 RepID=A0A225VPE0_9STRA|nr:reverse transcriptase [Phytophthora megakarya]
MRNSKSLRVTEISEPESQDPLEVPLKSGQRYGWWEDHEHGDMHGLATIHGAVNDSRTRILLDTGASVSIMSLDLARRLKLKLRTHRQIKVSGLGGVTTYITTHARVKITLGWSVVYVLNIWVGNIGEGVDVLLGMIFMHSAGVRLCIREGLVKLPDEETVVMYDDNPKSRDMDLPVCPEESIHLRPGQDAIVRIRYGQSNPQRELVWAGRGKNRVTKALYSTRSWATAVKVVNVSDQNVWIDTRTAVARIVEYGQFPGQPGFVRPGKARYEEWQQLIHECTVSRQARMRTERLEQILREREPPCTPTQRYQWPTKHLMRPQSQASEVKMAKLQEKLKPLDMTLKITGHSAVVMNTVTRDPEEPGTRPEPVEHTHSDLSPEVKTLDSEGVAALASRQRMSSRRQAVRHRYKDWKQNMLGLCESLSKSWIWNLLYISEKELRDQLIMLSEIEELTPECSIDEANVGVPGDTTPEMEAKMIGILKRHRSIFLGDGNAAPAPARGVVCDINVGKAKPVALRARQIAAPFWLTDGKLLEAELIEHSESEWPPPIVIVLKKNGIDIRMCIDYRLLNLLIKLSRYPLPLIDDLLVDFKSAMWFMSLDMASGFGAVRMTERAKLISAFVFPFSHFQWLRMPYGLKNAPLIYQSIINSCLWGFARLPPEEEAMVDLEVLEFLDFEPQEALKTELDMRDSGIPSLDMTVFRRNIPAPSQMGPVLGRSSYIDDIGHGASIWDLLYEDLEALLYRLRYWNISVSLPKSEFGKLTIPFLSHGMSADGISALPKIVKGIENLPFPSTYKGVQSLLGSLNYYNKFIEDLPVVTAALYELDEERVRAGRNLKAAKESFEILKRKIVSTPLLRHPDKTKPFVIIPHANPWAACAVLGQEHEGLIHPVRFTGRVLKESELRYDIAEKEVLAILRTLEIFRPHGSEFPVVVYTRYSELQ